MKAVICERYGGPEVLKLVELPKPMPKEGEILVRIDATTVNSGDVRIRALRVPRGMGLPMRLAMGFSRLRQPVLGMELAGEIEAVGGKVTAFRPGERVIAAGGFTGGCHAEYKCVKENAAIARIPEGLSDAEAVSLCFGGTTAADFLSRGGLKPGEHLLVNGASGAVGTMTVQIAKHRGAEVTGVCSAANAALVTSLGADHVIDYAKEDFSARKAAYDLIMDTAGNAPFSRVKEALRPGGRVLLVNGNLPQMLESAWRREIIGGVADPSKRVFGEPAFEYLMRLAAEGALRSVIDRTYPLEAIAAAHAYVDTGRKKGSVVITVGHDG